MLLKIALYAVAALAVAESRCPVFGRSHPCFCINLKDKKGETFSTVTCSDLHSEEELTEVLAMSKGFDIFELEIVNSSLMFLPQDAFEDTSFEVINIRDSSLMSLSDTDVAFKGLEKQLHLIEVINCSLTSGWDWKVLAGLEHLMELHVSDSDLVDVAEGISKIHHIDLEALTFNKNGIRVLTNFAFAPFRFLVRLSLDNNRISQVKRSMFPSPANHLKILGLSYNELTDLPIDLFHDMPALQSLYLTGNPLYTINENVFRPVWGQLKLFLFYDTRLSCDCRLGWLVREDNSNKYIHAQCSGPPKHRERWLYTLQPHELFCFAS